jgi:DNA mismatch repair protein MutS
MLSMTRDLTPVRKQYLEIKRQYPEAILFFRLGDFYETFDADAEIAARELEIVLTSRNIAKGARVPMAGIPHHAAESYLSRLIAKGYHVAICEQMGETPVRGLFPREVVRVITPGTVVEPGLLPGEENNYLAAVVVEPGGAGIAYADVSTGEFAAMQLEAEDPAAALRHELARLRPAEVLLPEGVPHDAAWAGHLTPLPEWRFGLDHAQETLHAHFGTATLDGFGLIGMPLAVRAAGAIVDYLGATQRAALSLLVSLRTYSLHEFMVIDAATRRNLELTETIRSGEVRGSLLGVIDKTETPMGRRLIRQWIAQPLLDAPSIHTRQDQVQAFLDAGMLRAEIRLGLRPLGDLERLTNRVVAGIAAPRDLTGLREALRRLPGVIAHMEGASGAALAALRAELNPCADALDLLERSIADDPPASLHAAIDFTPTWGPIVEALRVLAPGGRLVINAIRKEDRDKDALLHLDYATHLWREKEIKSTANVTRQDAREFLPLAAEIPIRPQVQEFPLEQANEALRLVKEGKTQGAAVLRIAEAIS